MWSDQIRTEDRPMKGLAVHAVCWEGLYTKKEGRMTKQSDGGRDMRGDLPRMLDQVKTLKLMYKNGRNKNLKQNKLLLF